MSSSALDPILIKLPYSLRQQVYSYAESVRSNLPQIFREASVEPNPRLAEQLLFLAGIRKLFDIISSSLWTLENSNSFLSEYKVSSVRIGNTDVGAKSEYRHKLKRLFTDLESTLGEARLMGYMKGSYSDVLKRISISNEFS